MPTCGHGDGLEEEVIRHVVLEPGLLPLPHLHALQLAQAVQLRGVLLAERVLDKLSKKIFMVFEKYFLS